MAAMIQSCVLLLVLAGALADPGLERFVNPVGVQSLGVAPAQLGTYRCGLLGVCSSDQQCVPCGLDRCCQSTSTSFINGATSVFNGANFAVPAVNPNLVNGGRFPCGNLGAYCSAGQTCVACATGHCCQSPALGSRLVNLGSPAFTAPLNRW